MASTAQQICASRRRLAAGVLVILLTSGCGAAKYEARLNGSRELYEYLQTLDVNLSPQMWQRPDLGLAMRLPRPFEAPLPGPASGRSDPRQKNILGVPLPGLVEGWAGSVGGKGDTDGYVYLLSNHDRFLTDGAEALSPGQFLKELETRLTTRLQVTIPPDPPAEAAQPKPNTRFRHLAPPPNDPHAKFTTTKEYVEIWLAPARKIAGRDYEARLYTRSEGEIQVAILVLYPQSTTAQFRRRVDLALETLQMSGARPQRATTSSSSGAPSGPSPAATKPSF